ncbi:hypothetical protein [Bdellovibrio bacteriovorus]|uniref:hypothetical protein n=1 Tax=Bdellovibrio bacteriovorus TaxID=959 RepID=UPI0035A742C6
MKTIVSSLLLMMALPAVSSAATSCRGVSFKHVFTVEQRFGDVEVTLDDEKLVKYRDIKNPTEGSLKISGRTRTTVLVENTTVDDFLAKHRLNRELAVGMIAGRAEYDGEQDMWYSYAGELYSSLKCQ